MKGVFALRRYQPLPFRNKEEHAVKGQWMLAIVSVAAVLAGPPASAQNPAAPTEPAPESDRPLGDDEAMVLNFERADIREVIHSLATALGISYTLDPRIEGQVTIRTTGSISRRELFPLFNQILRQNGIAAVQTGDIYQILPVGEAKTRAIIPRGAAAAGARRDDDFVIEIFQVRHVLAEEMANILQPFVTPGRRRAVLSARQRGRRDRPRLERPAAAPARGHVRRRWLPQPACTRLQDARGRPEGAGERAADAARALWRDGDR